jgi:hypothetical protein
MPRRNALIKTKVRDDEGAIGPETDRRLHGMRVRPPEKINRGSGGVPNYAANLTASLWPRIFTVCWSCSVLSGFFKTVIGPLASMRSSISLSG